MWEVQLFSFQGTTILGITPTYVGSTLLIYLLNYPCKDHPHVCGKYLVHLQTYQRYEGSPPRMWEVPGKDRWETLEQGITPTYVGSTFSKAMEYTITRDHPHVCGKYAEMAINDLINEGSPPRMWEVLSFQGSVFAYHRITPTYVGST